MKLSKDAQSFQEAIQIISKVRFNPDKFDSVSFLLSLAQENPGTLVSTYRKLHPTLKDQIIGLLRQNRKFQAIKLYRDECLVDLKTAKDAVDAIAAEENL